MKCFKFCLTIAILLALLTGCIYNQSPVSTPTPVPIVDASSVPYETPEPTDAGASTSNVSKYPQNKEYMLQRLCVEEITLLEIQEDVRDGEYSYCDLISFYAERIESFKGLNAIITVAESAMEQAKKCDTENNPLTPLYGIPIIVKDNIDTAGLLTTGGAYAFCERVPTEDAAIIANIKAAGAIVLAKANLDELAGFVIDYSGEGTPAHYSSVGGEVTSPYGAEHEVGGSSSGSAVAVNCNLAPLAIGTDTACSILAPTFSNSIVGMRPTVGKLSASGIIPANLSYDTAGPMARNVLDAAILLYYMSGSSETALDPASYIVSGGAESIKGMKIGLCDPSIPPEIIQGLENYGATVIDCYDKYIEFSENEMNNCSYMQYDYWKLSEGAYLAYDYGVFEGLNGFLNAEKPFGIMSVKELREFNSQHAGEAIPYGQGQLDYLVGLNEPSADELELMEAAKEYFSTTASLDAFMTSCGVDCMIYTNLGVASNYQNAPINPTMLIPYGNHTVGESEYLLALSVSAMNGMDEKAVLAAYFMEMIAGSNGVHRVIPNN